MAVRAVQVNRLAENWLSENYGKYLNGLQLPHLHSVLTIIYIKHTCLQHHF